MNLICKLLISVLILTLVSCASAIKPTQNFNDDDFKWALEEGAFSIKGEAFAMTMGGTPRTCAGTKVRLMPVNAYTEEVVKIDATAFQYAQRDPALSKYYKTATCNSKGEFFFTDLPKGEYFFEGSISWYAGTELQHANFNEKIKVDKNIENLSILPK